MVLTPEIFDTAKSRQEFTKIFHGQLVDIEEYDKFEAEQLLLKIIEQADKLKTDSSVNLNELFKFIDYLRKLPCSIC